MIGSTAAALLINVVLVLRSSFFVLEQTQPLMCAFQNNFQENANHFVPFCESFLPFSNTNDDSPSKHFCNQLQLQCLDGLWFHD